MHGEAIDQWATFALAHVGASAALVGLVFVALSINLGKVVASRALANRAAESIVHLGNVVVGSTLVLLPGGRRRVTGAELLAVGVVVLASVARLQRGMSSTTAGSGDRSMPRTSVAFRRISGLGAPTLGSLAGVSLLAGVGGGLYWWAAAVLVSYLAALLGAWVLLVEILR